MKSKKAKAGGVGEYLDALKHPLRPAILALRKSILSVDSRIEEEVKWNAPSFKITEHFATFRLNPAPICQLILHTGAKVRKRKARLPIDDPHGILEWASMDRAVVDIASSADAKAKTGPLKAILEAWIEHAGID